MRVIAAVERFIYQSKPSRLIAIALAAAFFKTGFWYIPTMGTSWAISRNPFRNPFSGPEAEYLLTSWLGPFLAWCLHIRNEQSFLYFHLLFSFAFTCIFIAFVWREFGDREARTSLILFLALPVSTTAYFNIGYDSVTLFLMLLLLLVRRRPWLALPIGVLLGMQHFEQGAVACGALLVAWLIGFLLRTKSQYSIQWTVASLLGVVLGKLVLLLIFRHFRMHVTAGRLFYVQHFTQLYSAWFYYHFQYILWSILGVGWFAAVKYAEQGKSAAHFFIALCGPLLLLLIVGDETRVVAIVTFPLVAACLLLDPEFLRSLSGRFVSAIFGVWLLVPYPWVLDGKPLVSMLPYNVAYFLHQHFGWFNVPMHQPMWPIAPL